MTLSFLLLLCPLLLVHSVRPNHATQSANAGQSPTATNATPNRTVTDSAAAHEIAQLRISEFHALWQRTWRDGEHFRGRYVARQTLDMAVRWDRQHCHRDGRDETGKVVQNQGVDADSVDQLRFIFSIIASRHSYYATCPSWLLSPGVEGAGDETHQRDAALLPEHRPEIFSARKELLQELDSIALVWPKNVWLTGQRTRLYVDQNDPAGALNAAQSCKGEAWWCSALIGYVQARDGKTWPAQAAFAAMHAAMPNALACEWNDVRNLLHSRERGPYTRLNCQQRSDINTRFWWLSDPLFRTRANERRVEDDMRRVEIELRKEVEHDERYTWIEKDGGDALAELVERYGWPTYTANMTRYGGMEKSHTGYLNNDQRPPYPISPRMAPYTTFEYSMDRVHTVPKWSMLESPFSITDSAWILRSEGASGTPQTGWWPAEHYQPEKQIVQLYEGQTGMFRRQSQILMATALPLKHPMLRTSANARYDIMLLASKGPGHLDSLAQVVDTAGATIALQGLIAPTPHIIAVEALGARDNGVDARSRFGVTPPLPLDSMKRGEIAVSDPVLLRSGSVGDAPIPGEELLDRMLATTSLNSATRRISLYWETYGLTAVDTVKVFVRLVGEKDLTIAQRLAVAVRVSDNPNGTIVQEWTEPDASRGTRTLDGLVPVQMRTIVLNLSQLEPGPYRIEVGVQRKNGSVAFGLRRISVEP